MLPTLAQLQSGARRMKIKNWLVLTNIKPYLQIKYILTQ